MDKKEMRMICLSLLTEVAHRTVIGTVKTVSGINPSKRACGHWRHYHVMELRHEKLEGKRCFDGEVGGNFVQVRFEVELGQHYDRKLGELVKVDVSTKVEEEIESTSEENNQDGLMLARNNTWMILLLYLSSLIACRKEVAIAKLRNQLGSSFRKTWGESCFMCR